VRIPDCAGTMAEVNAFVGVEQQHDDITALILRVIAESSPPSPVASRQATEKLSSSYVRLDGCFGTAETGRYTSYAQPLEPRRRISWRRDGVGWS
jgi:hypothetical protein